MTVFLDSSAIVKRYVDEAHAPEVLQIREPIVASALAQVEVPAAFWGKTRLADLPRRHAQTASSAFFNDCGSGGPYSFVDVAAEVLRLGSRLVTRHPLRSADAVQLASALIARSVLGDCEFGSFDHRLNDAAAAEGFALASWAR